MNGAKEPLVPVEWLGRIASDPDGARGYGIARVRESERDSAGLNAGDLVLAPRVDGEHATQAVSAGSCVALPSALTVERASQVARLALSLWTWDSAELELGEIAVFTSGSSDRMLAVVAGWRSARDPVRLVVHDTASSPTAAVTDFAVSDSERTSAALAAALRAAPGAVAAVTIGRTDALDLILESAPMWARIVLAAGAGDPATIDFYNNVHRKGCRMLSVPATPAEMLSPFWKTEALPHIARAARILQNDVLAAALLT